MKILGLILFLVTIFILFAIDSLRKDIYTDETEPYKWEKYYIIGTIILLPLLIGLSFNMMEVI